MWILPPESWSTACKHSNIYKETIHEYTLCCFIMFIFVAIISVLVVKLSSHPLTGSRVANNWSSLTTAYLGYSVFFEEKKITITTYKQHCKFNS